MKLFILTYANGQVDPLTGEEEVFTLNCDGKAVFFDTLAEAKAAGTALRLTFCTWVGVRNVEVPDDTLLAQMGRRRGRERKRDYTFPGYKPPHWDH